MTSIEEPAESDLIAAAFEFAPTGCRILAGFKGADFDFGSLFVRFAPAGTVQHAFAAIQPSISTIQCKSLS